MNLTPPPGCTLLQSSQVTSEMTQWSVDLLHDATQYPMGAFACKAFGTLQVLGHVEWHPPDANNESVHRGITLYEIPQTGYGAANVQGVDVSGYQPSVDWGKVAAAGKYFAFVKTTEGTTLTDGAFASHWAGAKAAGILRGGYHFLRPTLDGRAQAKFFLSKLAADAGELPPVLDVEVVDGAPYATVAKAVSDWVDEVTTALGRCIIYTAPSFWNPLRDSVEASKADVWIAQWGVSSPTCPAGWNNWTFWQFTDKATISGIPGTADMDENKFNGSYFGLLAYASAAAPPKPSFDLPSTAGVQAALNYLGYAAPPLAVDGAYGADTKASVEAFQKANSLAVDGVVGPDTVAALQSALAAHG